MNIDYNNITPGDLWFARFVWLVVGIIIGLAVGG
jgi:hypothetical protein